MTVENAENKMRELMLTIDSLNRFSNIRSKFPTLLLVALFSILMSVVIFALVEVYDYNTVTWLGNIKISSSGYVGGWLIASVAWIGGMISVYLVMDRAYRKPREVNWEEDLNEGPVGIIKIMSRYDWDRILLELRWAKQGFALVSVLQLILYFFIIIIVLFFLFVLLVQVLLQVHVNGYYILISALIVTLIVGDKTLVRLYNRLWNANILIEELRRFHFEFSKREL